MDVPAAYAFNYHFDNGVFRGLAFANYRTSEETEIVVNTINGLEIGGRKLRVEYKKVLPNSSSSTNLMEYNNMKEREAVPIASSSTSSQPSSPMMGERKLNTSTEEGNLKLPKKYYVRVIVIIQVY